VTPPRADRPTATSPRTRAELLEAAQLGRDRGDDAKARLILVDLIKNSPDSRFVPDAWLALAEISFAHADMKSAEQEYLQVVRSPAPGGYGFAFYKLAYVSLNDNRGDRALDAFKKVMEWSARYPQHHGAAERGVA